MATEDRAAVLHRLRSARGHLNAVIRMMERQAPCDEVIDQLCAVQAALRAAGCRLLEADIRECMRAVRSDPSGSDRDQALDRLASLVKAMGFTEFNWNKI